MPVTRSMPVSHRSAAVKQSGGMMMQKSRMAAPAIRTGAIRRQSPEHERAYILSPMLMEEQKKSYSAVDLPEDPLDALYAQMDDAEMELDDMAEDMYAGGAEAGMIDVEEDGEGNEESLREAQE